MKAEIIEGNKLIAEFDGYEYLPQGSINGIKGILVKEGMMSMHLEETKPFHAKYHKDWNTLMAVVEKIEKQGLKCEIGIASCVIYSGQYNTVRVYAETKIKAVWLAVVEFIKWYNSQQVEK